MGLLHRWTHNKSYFSLRDFLNRKGALAAKSAGRASSVPPRSPHTCSSTRTRDPIPANTAGRGSTRSPTWKNTPSSTQVRAGAPSAWLPSPNTADYFNHLLLLQGRSRTNARCVGRRSVRAPTWSLTAGSTRASSRSAVTCAGKASKGRWTWGGTRRRSTDSNKQIWLNQALSLNMGQSFCSLHWSAVFFSSLFNYLSLVFTL